MKESDFLTRLIFFFLCFPALLFVFNCIKLKSYLPVIECFCTREQDPHVVGLRILLGFSCSHLHWIPIARREEKHKIEKGNRSRCEKKGELQHEFTFTSRLRGPTTYYTFYMHQFDLIARERCELSLLTFHKTNLHSCQFLLKKTRLYIAHSYNLLVSLYACLSDKFSHTFRARWLREHCLRAHCSPYVCRCVVELLKCVNGKASVLRRSDPFSQQRQHHAHSSGSKIGKNYEIKIKE